MPAWRPRETSSKSIEIGSAAFYRDLWKRCATPQSIQKKPNKLSVRSRKPPIRMTLRKRTKPFIKVWERVPYVSTSGVQSVLNFTRHPEAKSAKPEQFIDNSMLTELEKGGFVKQLYGR